MRHVKWASLLSPEWTRSVSRSISGGSEKRKETWFFLCTFETVMRHLFSSTYCSAVRPSIYVDRLINLSCLRTYLCSKQSTFVALDDKSLLITDSVLGLISPFSHFCDGDDCGHAAVYPIVSKGGDKKRVNVSAYPPPTAQPLWLRRKGKQATIAFY
jgi:hypothetical protein